MKQADDSFLEMEIEVHNNDKWQVFYREGEKYSLHQYKSEKERKSWQEARAFCKDINNTLATVQSVGEMMESGISSQDQSTFWIGASDIEAEDVWTWLDGSPWPLRLKPFLSNFYSHGS